MGRRIRPFFSQRSPIQSGGPLNQWPGLLYPGNEANRIESIFGIIPLDLARDSSLLFCIQLRPFHWSVCVIPWQKYYAIMRSQPSSHETCHLSFGPMTVPCDGLAIFLSRPMIQLKTIIMSNNNDDDGGVDEAWAFSLFFG